MFKDLANVASSAANNVRGSTTKELLQQIEKQNEELLKYKKRTRDLVVSYKTLIDEKSKLQSTLETLTTGGAPVIVPVESSSKKSILKKFNNNITRRGQLYSRSATFKQIYLTSASLGKFCFDSPGARRLHIVNAGTLVFQKKRKYSMVDASYRDAEEYEPYRKLRKRVRKALV